MFEETISKFTSSSSSAGDNSTPENNITEEVINDNKERTYRNLRTRDLIKEKSSEAALIVA